MSYLIKDIKKFAICNKLISRGAINSSSYKYSRGEILNIPLENINTAEYCSSDIVGVSVNGARKNRVSFDRDLLLLALKAKASIVTDNKYHRNRSFNVGEREVAKFLLENGYTATEYKDRAVWQYTDYGMDEFKDLFNMYQNRDY